MPSQLSPQTLPHSHHHHHHCFHLPHRHHHHHCLYTSVVPSLQLCPCLLYHHHHHHHHFNGCSSHVHFIPAVISSIPPNSCPVPACSSSGYPKVSTAAEASVSQSGVQQQDQNQDLILEEFGEEEELEDIFVLSDEWRDFFAKSEAKRRMDKQQKKKHRKGGA